MPKKEIKKSLPKFENIEISKIKVFFKRSILETIMNILLMEHSSFRSYKTIKNFNRLFTNIDESLYVRSAELTSYIWCIKMITKKWIDGITNRDLVIEAIQRDKDFDNIKKEIIDKHYNNQDVVSVPEAETIFSLVSEALQYGVLTVVKDNYIQLLENISLDHPGAFQELSERLFEISHSMLDIKYNTNFVSNEVIFNSEDETSIDNAIVQTMDSLKVSNNMFKTGIKRLNTLLSPAYMNGRLYLYLGTPGAGKSIILLKSALDIRKYNPDFKPKTPGLKPAVLYITMENSFTETIERVWNMTFDNEDMTNYSYEEAKEKLMEELGFGKNENGENGSNIAIEIQFHPYRSISTDDIHTLISDMKDEGLEICALCLDYVKRIRPSIPSPDSIKVELARIINELKAIALIYDIPVITAQQINRSGAAKIDNAIREGKQDVTKLVGRENVGDA